MSCHSISEIDQTSGADKVAGVTVDFFSPLVDQTFLLHIEEGVSEPLILVSVTPAPASHGLSGSRKPFSMIFRARNREFHVTQGTYLLENAEAGPLHIFIVPIGPDDVGMQFQAVFN